MSNDPGAGWHPDPTGQFDHRYWDGTRWTEHVSTAGRQSSSPLGAAPPSTPPTTAQPSSAQPPAQGRSPRRGGRAWKWVAVAFATLVVIGIATSSSEDDKGSSRSEPASTTARSTTEPAASVETPHPKPAVEVDWTSPQETTHDRVTLRGTVSSGAHVKVSGRRAAVSGATWSKVVPIKKHGANVFHVVATREGYTSGDVEALVTRKLSARERAAQRKRQAERRANARALEAAENYLALGGMSKKGLYEQLSSSAGEGFTAAQAQYAVDHVRVDWKKEAVESARSYLKLSPMSRDELLQQLSSDAGEGFTYEQALYAVNKVY